MYKRYAPYVIMMAVYAGLLLARPASAMEAAKVLIQIDADVAPSTASKTMEMLIAERLLGSGYRIAVSHDTTSASWLTSDDIRSAKKGKMAPLRKAAAFHGAHLILSGLLKLEVTSGKLLDVDFKKGVASLSFKVIQTVSGRILDIDTLQFREAGGSPEEAVHKVLVELAEGISRLFIGNTDVHISPVDDRYIQSFQERVAKTNDIEKSTLQVPPPGIKTGIKTGMKKGALADTAFPQHPPEIGLVYPPIDNTDRMVEKRKRVTIEGWTLNAEGVQFVDINGTPVELNQQGKFTFKTTLANGENRFLITTVDSAGGSITKSFMLVRPADKTPPEITLTHPLVTRGVKVVIRESFDPTVVSGFIKDDSDVAYLKINGVNIPFDEKGFFSSTLILAKDAHILSIEAADEAGNTTAKEFTIADRQAGTRRIDPTGDREDPRTIGMKPVLWGLCIGVSKYTGKAADLKYAHADAEALAAFLKRQAGKLFSEVHIRTLVNERVTRNSIIESMTAHLGQAAMDDVVFVFLAGHGIKHRQSGSYYFLPHDTDHASVLSLGLRMSDFEEAVKILSKNVTKVIIVMDTCHAGAMQVGSRTGEGGEDLAEALKKAAGLFILAAAKAGEASLEDGRFKLQDKDGGHGVFTYALLEGMSGKANFDLDDHISLYELFQYVAKRVPRLTQGRQHPYFRLAGSDMPFILMDK